MFGRYVYDGSRWHAREEWDDSVQPDVWLTLDVFDSDLASVRYFPNGPGAGVAYLGHTPRAYFGEDEASEPTDVRREAAGLAAWWAATGGAGDTAGKADEIAGLLAADDGSHEGETFVEDQAARFLAALGVPLPADFQGGPTGA
ncbi:hypothetical protein [Actinokineospora diospyrosa]|uniref:Uncharacterized protein n=1 Tax=Actinokineospora diospyrosa TaxID=103728 RepID=A0ABT1IES5_9PSEU|nr:hypothetical protein [Actinokineospora diospyrosa]MCP2271133.1 hypothetical protein [Actinokineospora diospyrosa]